MQIPVVHSENPAARLFAQQFPRHHFSAIGKTGTFSMSYLALKHFHVTCAALSGSLFLLRGFWMLLDSPVLQRRWVRIAPHVIDTLLLTSALVLVFWSGQYPFVQNWLTAKVIALIAYIGLGTIALKRGKTRAVRVSAFIAALLVFAYIVGVAVTRQAMPLG
ncbi:MAG: SirB2 family protein [Oxalobacteraceae bacterium]